MSGLRPDRIAFGVPIMAVLQKHILSAVGGIQGKKIPPAMGGNDYHTIISSQVIQEVV